MTNNIPFGGLSNREEYMKKLFILAAVLMLAACDNGSVFNGQTKLPDNVTRLETAGWDARIYEFTPSTAQNMTCVFVAGSKKAGLDCFSKKVK